MAGHVGLRGVRANEPCEPVGLARRWRPGGAAGCARRWIGRGDGAPPSPRPPALLDGRDGNGCRSGQLSRLPELPPCRTDGSGRRAGLARPAAPAVELPVGRHLSARRLLAHPTGRSFPLCPGHGMCGAGPRWSSCPLSGQNVAAVWALQGRFTESCCPEQAFRDRGGAAWRAPRAQASGGLTIGCGRARMACPAPGQIDHPAPRRARRLPRGRAK